MKERQSVNINSLLNFFNESPTAWHVVSNSIKELSIHGFQELKEDNSWKIKFGGKYFVTRNGSSICAFIIPKIMPKGIHLAASHTDSPSFKLKPNAEFVKENMQMLGVEIYGAPILASWLNRDLGIAGRVIYRDSRDSIHEKIVACEDHSIVIPQLAIHLDRNVNENGLIVHKQDHLAALTGIHNKKGKTFIP